MPELSERKPLGKGLPLQKPEKTLVQVIAPGVTTDATDEDPLVENVEMEIEVN